jgi:hypothetical protein
LCLLELLHLNANLLWSERFSTKKFCTGALECEAAHTDLLARELDFQTPACGRSIRRRTAMAKHHLVLTEQEFDELAKMKPTPLQALPISDREKKILLDEARAKRGGATTDMRIVICRMVDDAVVCVVTP